MGTRDEAVSAAFEQMDELIAVYEGDDLVIVAANPRGLAELGGAEVLGRSAPEVLAGWGPPGVLDVLRRVQRTGRAESHTDWRVQAPLPDGRTDERVYSFQVHPWKGDDGSVRGVVARARNVSFEAGARRQGGPDTSAVLDTVKTLQDVLLPEDVPILPGLDIDGSYLLGAEVNAGGDWYDVVIRPNGRVALVTGDVVGHGPSASASMGQLRAVLRDHLLDEVSLADAVRATDRRIESRLASVAVAEVDPRTGAVEYVTAGHPSPLVVGAEGQTSSLPPSGAGPLGSGSAIKTSAARLGAGEMIVLHTDGAITRPDRGRTEAQAELATIISDTFLNRALSVGAPARATERVCRTGLELLTRRTGHTHDITLLAAQRVPRPPALALQLPAEPRSVSACRLELAAWMDAIGARSLDAIALQHAVGELVDNVVAHAYGDGLPTRLDPSSAVCVDASLLPSGEVEVVVADHGSWRDSDQVAGTQRGLAMARGFMDRMSVERSGAGTRVTVRHRLSRVPLLATSTQVRENVANDFGVAHSTGLVSVHGGVDARTVPELRVTLDRATQGRTRALTVDLTEVTHLSSPGVQLLYELLRDDPDVDLVARAGSVADHVLDLVQLQHAT